LRNYRRFVTEHRISVLSLFCWLTAVPPAEDVPFIIETFNFYVTFLANFTVIQMN